MKRPRSWEQDRKRHFRGNGCVYVVSSAASCPLFPSLWSTEIKKFPHGKMHGEMGVVTLTDGDTFTCTMHTDRPSKRVLTKAFLMKIITTSVRKNLEVNQLSMEKITGREREGIGEATRNRIWTREIRGKGERRWFVLERPRRDTNEGRERRWINRSDRNLKATVTSKLMRERTLAVGSAITD